MFFQKIGLILLSYLAGGIPTGYLVVKKMKGFDIRTRGSGNPGTANVYRMAGKRAGAITLFVDALKGYFPVLVAGRLYPYSPNLALACGAAAIVGHDWTVFLGFKGGKGVATSAGVFAALAPRAVAGVVAVFVAGFWLSGHISVGSMAGALALPIFNLIFADPAGVTLMSAVSAALILYKHVPNIKRLMEHKELHLHEKN
jgi:glycerol-3-phosphate acyltransferase PlsY